MVKEEEGVMAEAGGGGRGGYMDLLGLGEEDYLLCLSPSSYFFTPSLVSATATTTTTAAAPSPTCCCSYLDPAPAHHHALSFADHEQYHGDDGVPGFQHSGGDRAVPAAVPHKSSPTAECSSSMSLSSSPPATAVSAVSSSKPQASKKKRSRSSDQRKPASATALAAAATNKRPRVRRERLGERIVALQQLVSPFGKSDTASVLHEALGYIRFLHDQVQVLSSPYMQRQPASVPVPAQESATGTVVEPPRPGDLRSRGLCLVPVSCTEHLAANGNGHGHGNGADLWSVVAGIGMGAAKAAAGNEGAAGGTLLPGGGGHPRFTDYARV